MYTFTTSCGNTEKISATVTPSVEMPGNWNVTFKPATGVKDTETTFEKLVLWNEQPEPAIKYFSGTATYTKSFNLTTKQASSPVRLQLGEVHDISRVWVNGHNMGIIWTNPWTANLTGVLIEGANELKIEVTNCWANRLIGDSGLPESKWTTKTNVRRVPDRSEYKRGHQAFSATDELYPSGLVGPVLIEFGDVQTVYLKN